MDDVDVAEVMAWAASNMIDCQLTDTTEVRARVRARVRVRLGLGLGQATDKLAD